MCQKFENTEKIHVGQQDATVESKRKRKQFEGWRHKNTQRHRDATGVTVSAVKT